MKANRIAGHLSFLFLLGLYRPSSFFSPDPDGEITLMAVGDVMLGRFVDSRYQGRISSDKISGVFRSADVIFGNLEACFGGGISPAQQKAVNLKAPDSALSALKDLGFTVVSLANNHCEDFGADAVAHTQTLLETNGIRNFGGFSQQGKAIPLLLTIKTVSIGLLGYSAHVPSTAPAGPGYSGIAPLSSESVLSDIAALRPRVDVLIASVHWGRECSDGPTAEQVTMAHQMADAGVDVVWGHHPHVLQGVENYKGKLIAYSLGNFIFDQVGSGATQSMILQCDIRKRRIFKVRVIPVMVDRYLPRLANAEEGMTLLNHVRRLSDQLTLDPDMPVWRIQWNDGENTIRATK